MEAEVKTEVIEDTNIEKIPRSYLRKNSGGRVLSEDSSSKKNQEKVKLYQILKVLFNHQMHL